MSDIMRPIPFHELLNRVRNEYKKESSVFGIRSDKFFHPSSFENEIFGKKISAPIGPSAGPGTQCAQNIFAAFLAGARYMELKTVQPMDGEDVRTAVSRPSVNAANEGFNIEWTNELTVAELLDEYIKAWFLCHIFAVEFGISEAADIIFTMSIGYSLDGIMSEKVDSYIEGMKNAINTESWKRCYDHIASNISSFDHFTKADLDAVPPEISRSVIVSAFYDCPVDEIEKMASYFLNEKKAHTSIKCNPTLLGYETVRALLDIMGYGYISFNERHFKDEIHIYDMIKILKHLKTLSAKDKLVFGVKLTNSFPVEIKRNELPGNEMYMSGRPLFPLALHTAKKLSEAFHGELPVSFSGGADFFNLKSILETGIRPVTMATNILKPGGPERFYQLAQTACGIAPNDRGISLKALNALCESLTEDRHYRRDYRRADSRKASSALPVFDCAVAPCANGCPVNVEIPEFLAAAASGDYKGAFKIIAENNPCPSITGSLCDHICQQKCARLDYEDHLQIKTVGMIAADRAQEEYILSLTPAKIVSGKTTAAVIGAGPAGIAAAVFLRRNGVPVTVYEKRSRPFGAVQHVIPSFRIPDEAIQRDYQMALKTGVEFVFNVPEEYSVEELKKKHNFVLIATGTWKKGHSIVKKGQENILDAMSFLEESKKSDYNANLGKKVAVIGGGKAAIDCARAAKRNRGVESVTIIYRRTREFMPALREDQELALADKVIIWELLNPESWEDGILTCEEMELGDYDSSGRRNIKASDKKQKLKFDSVISAVGTGIDREQFDRNRILFDGNLPAVNAFESSVSGVYIAGCCRTGGSTVANAIADGKAAAAEILKKLKIKGDFTVESALCIKTDTAGLYRRKGVICEAKNDNTEGERCLSCNRLCEICADVCPHRANVSILLPATDGKPENRQILHIDSMCNECGNCASFCPHDGKPYLEKPTLFYSEEDFFDSENPGFVKAGFGKAGFVKADDSFKVRLEDKSVHNYHCGGKNIPREWALFIDTAAKKYGYLFYNEPH